MSGYIKLHRALADWEWYHNNNATRLLIHLLISVNYKDKKWAGRIIKKGSMVLSWQTLSEGCHLSVQQCRTAMDKLIESGEVTKEVTNKYQVISLVKWEQMQIEEVEPTNKLTDNQQTNNKQVTTTKESKERKKGNKVTNVTIPAWEEFLDYAEEKKPTVNHQDLKLKYESWKESGWMTGGKSPRKIKNWKSTLLNTLPYIKEKSSGKKEKEDAGEIAKRIIYESSKT